MASVAPVLALSADGLRVQGLPPGPGNPPSQDRYRSALEQAQMNSNDEETQVFIVRLWREAREIEGARPLLRGTVEHVASGRAAVSRGAGRPSADILALFRDDRRGP